jgi:hypothetical protein
VGEPERPLVPQREGPSSWRARLLLPARWAREAAELQGEAAPERQQLLVCALLSPGLKALPNRYRMWCQQPADALLPLPLEAWQPRDLLVAWRQWRASRAAGPPQSEVPDGVEARSAVVQAEREARDVDPVRWDWSRPHWKHRDSAWPAQGGPVRGHPDLLAGLMQAGPQWRKRLARQDEASPVTALALHSGPRHREPGSKLRDAPEYRAWLPEAERLAGGVDAGLWRQLHPCAAGWP